MKLSGGANAGEFTAPDDPRFTRRQRLGRGMVTVATRAARLSRATSSLLDRILWRLPGPLPALTYFGADILCDPRDLIQGTILRFGVWEPNVSALLEAFLNEGDVLVDVGANCGYDTLLGAALVGPSGKAVAIEASPRCFSELSRNVALNRELAGRTVLVHAAASDKHGELSVFSGPPTNAGATTLLASRNLEFECTVQGKPLRDLIPDELRPLVSMIKIDIEGSEIPVMRNLLSNLESYPRLSAVIVEVSPCAEWAAVFDQLREKGYSAYSVINPYERTYYRMHHREVAMPTALRQIPHEQTDVLFTKRRLDEMAWPPLSRWRQWRVIGR